MKFKLAPKFIQYAVIGLQVILTIILASTSAEQAAKSERSLYDLPVTGTVQNGRLIVTPRTPSVTPGTIGYVDINVDTGGAVINSVGMELNYRSDLIDIQAMQFDHSVCNVIIEQKIIPDTGTVKVSCGLPNPGVNTQLDNVVALKYRALNPGVATFNFVANSTTLLANDGLGTNVLLYALNGSLNIADRTASNPDTNTNNQTTTNTSTNNSNSSTTTYRTSTTPSNNSANNNNSSSTPDQSSTTSAQNSTTTKAIESQVGGFALAGIFKVPVSAQIKLASPLNCTLQDEVTFIWLRQDGIDGFEYQLSDILTEMKDPIRSNDSQVTYKIEPGKKYFFQIRAIKGTNKGPSGLATFSTCTGEPSRGAVSQMSRSFSQRSFAILHQIGEWIAGIVQDLLR